MFVRPTTRTDIPAVDALLARSYPVLLKPDYASSVLVTAVPLICRAQPVLVCCGTYYGVFDGNVLVGAGGWTSNALCVKAHERPYRSIRQRDSSV